MKAQGRLKPLSLVLTSKCGPEFKVVTWMRPRSWTFKGTLHPSQGGRLLRINKVTNKALQMAGAGGHLSHSGMTTTQCSVVKTQNRSPSHVSCTMSTVAKDTQANKPRPLRRSACSPRSFVTPNSHDITTLKINTENGRGSKYTKKNKARQKKKMKRFSLARPCQMNSRKC